MKERELRKKLFDAFKKTNVDNLIFRVETHTVTQGVPDIYIALNKKCLWLELKCCNTAKIIIPYRESQKLLLLRHNALYFNMFTLLYYNKRYFLLDLVYSHIKDEQELTEFSVWHDYTLITLPLFLDEKLIIV